MKCPKFRLPYMANLEANDQPAGQMTDLSWDDTPRSVLGSIGTGTPA